MAEKSCLNLATLACRIGDEVTKAAGHLPPFCRDTAAMSMTFQLFHIGKLLLATRTFKQLLPRRLASASSMMSSAEERSIKNAAAARTSSLL